MFKERKFARRLLFPVHVATKNSSARKTSTTTELACGLVLYIRRNPGNVLYIRYKYVSTHEVILTYCAIENAFNRTKCHFYFNCSSNDTKMILVNILHWMTKISHFSRLGESGVLWYYNAMWPKVMLCSGKKL